MDLNYKVTNIFPVPIHQFDVNGFGEIQDELIDYAYNLKKEDKGVTLVHPRILIVNCHADFILFFTIYLPH